MLEFVHSQNLLRYMDRLHEETDAGRRETLHALLVEEENRYGASRERTQQAQDHVEALRQRIRQQDALISRLSQDGADVEAAEALRARWCETLAILQRYAQD